MTEAAALGAPAMPIEKAHALLGQPGSMFELSEADIRGVRTKIWKNAPPTLRDIFNMGAVFAAREHLILDDDRVTVGGLRAAAGKIAAQLIADGLKPGDRVAIVMRNLPEWPAAFWGAMLAGAIVTPLNAWWTGSELEFGLQDSGSSVLFVDVERYERLREHLPNCPALKKIYVARAREEIADPSVSRLESLIGAPNDWNALPPPAIPDLPMAPDDDVAIFYTSGTTGKPKGAVISHRNIISNFFNSASALARAFLRRGEKPPAPDPTVQRVSLISIPFFHATGCFVVMIPNMMTGGKIVMQRRWDCDGALALIERERINTAGGVPTIAWQILENPNFDKHDLSSLDQIGYGGAPSAPELVRRIKQRFPKSNPTTGWGMTETSATATNNVAEDYERKPDSCGVPSATGEARIVGPDGKDVPRGEVGELWYKGPIVVRGYWNNPGATAETFADGWVKTGDLAKMDEEGFLYIVDRAKDMLIRGGENIYCVEVENVLYEYPGVIDAAVIGREHKTLGEEPIAVVHVKPGSPVTAEQLRHHAAQKLAAFKVPVDVVFWPETLPRNANGKIVKKDLKEKLAYAQF